MSNDQLEILQYAAETCSRSGHRNGVEVVPEMLLRLVDEVKRSRAQGAELAAAEERGRRRGVEERDRYREALMLIRSRAGASGDSYVYDTADAALAPRDSAPPRRCGDAPVGRCNACGGPSAPRDSAPQSMEGAPCGECGAVFGTHASWCHHWSTATNNPNSREPRSSATDSVTPSALPRDEGKEG